jgi:hypothetical protein
MSNLTDRYVFVSKATAVVAADNLSAKIDLGPIMERVPYTMVEIVSASLLTATVTEDVYVFKTQEIAMNGYTASNSGSVLGVLTNVIIDITTAPDKQAYVLNGVGAKLVFGGQTRFLNLVVQTGAGVVKSLADVAPFTMIIKCSYPRVGQIQEEYRSQMNI